MQILCNLSCMKTFAYQSTVRHVCVIFRAGLFLLSTTSCWCLLRLESPDMSRCTTTDWWYTEPLNTVCLHNHKILYHPL